MKRTIRLAILAAAAVLTTGAGRTYAWNQSVAQTATGSHVLGNPAAKVRPAQGASIASIEDLLQGIVKEANSQAERLGVRVGQTGKQALELL